MRQSGVLLSMHNAPARLPACLQGPRDLATLPDLARCTVVPRAAWVYVTIQASRCFWYKLVKAKENGERVFLAKRAKDL
jgi:hypothetical protein